MKSSDKISVTGHHIDNLYNINKNYYRKQHDLNNSYQAFTATNTTSAHQWKLANFLKIYFDFSYYLCISPFRLVRCVKHQEVDDDGIHIDDIRKRQEVNRKIFCIHTWLPQQFVCAIMHGLCLLRIITEARINTPDRLDLYQANPEQYFLLIMNIFNVVYKGMFIKQLWRHKQDMLIAANFAATEPSLPSTHPKRLRNAWIIRLVLALNLGMALLSLLAGKYFLSRGFLKWSPMWWYRRLATSTRYTFFYGNKTKPHEAPKLEEIQFLDNCLISINLIGLISRYILGYYTDLFILALALTLWSASYSFAQSFGDINAVKLEELDYCYYNHHRQETDKNKVDYYDSGKKTNIKRGQWAGLPDKNTWPSIYASFKAIRVLSYLINRALGSTVCWFMGDAILAYSLNLDAVFISKDLHQRAGLVFNYFCAFGVLFVAADVCKQMEAIKIWLSIDENRKTVPVDQVNIILHEMLAKDVGIRGADIFTITYPIVATFIGTCLTYFIICVQQNTSHV